MKKPQPIRQGGYDFFSLRDVGKRTGLSPSTLRHWAIEGVTTLKWPFHSTTNEKGYRMVREDTIQRLEERFLTLPDHNPAGKVKLGKTSDQSGYIAIPQARREVAGLKEVMTESKLLRIVNQIARGGEVPGVRLELIEDPLWRGKRLATEKSLLALAQIEREQKIRFNLR